MAVGQPAAQEVGVVGAVEVEAYQTEHQGGSALIAQDERPRVEVVAHGAQMIDAPAAITA